MVVALCRVALGVLVLALVSLGAHLRPPCVLFRVKDLRLLDLVDLGHAATEEEQQREGGVRADVVVGEGAAILQ